MRRSDGAHVRSPISSILPLPSGSTTSLGVPPTVPMNLTHELRIFRGPSQTLFSLRMAISNQPISRWSDGESQ